MKEIKLNFKSDPINVSTDELWKHVGPGFADIYKWSVTIDHSTGSGNSEFEGAACDIRGCDINAKGFNKVSEKLDYYDEEKKALSYVVLDGLPGFVKLARNSWQVQRYENNLSVLEIKATIQLGGVVGWLMSGMMKTNISKAINSTLRDLKIYAETGKVSKEKAARIKKFQSK